MYKRQIYDFIWDDYCDWYIELTKTRLNGTDEAAKLTAQNVLCYVLVTLLKLLHPFMPFITEEIYQALPKCDGASDILMMAQWPEYTEALNFPTEENAMEAVKDAISAVRARRAEMNVPPSRKAKIIIASQTPEIYAGGQNFITRLAYASEVEVGSQAPQDLNGMVTVSTHDATMYLPLAELVDIEKELERIQKELGITTIIVTHDHEEAVSLADRVIVMNAGHILQIGKPQEVFDRPASPFIADFMGFSTFLHGIAAGAEGDMRLIRCGAHTLQVPAEAAQELTEGDACILAIRSENIRTAEQEGVNTVRGTVKSATYKGHTTRLEVSGCFEEMVYPAIHEYADVQEGSEVLLHFPAQHFCVYKDIK